MYFFKTLCQPRQPCVYPRTVTHRHSPYKRSFLNWSCLVLGNSATHQRNRDLLNLDLIPVFPSSNGFLVTRFLVIPQWKAKESFSIVNERNTYRLASHSADCPMMFLTEQISPPLCFYHFWNLPTLSLAFINYTSRYLDITFPIALPAESRRHQRNPSLDLPSWRG